MKKIITITAAAIFLLISSIIAQNSKSAERYTVEDQDKIDSAKKVIVKYMEISRLQFNADHKIREKSKKSLDSLVKENAKIIFDIPIKIKAIKRNNDKRYLEQKYLQSELNAAFGKEVSIDMYFGILEKSGEQIKDSSYRVDTTGRKHYSKVNSTIVFEIEKIFDSTSWLKADSKKYFVEIDATSLLINEIRLHHENIIKKNVVITLTGETFLTKDTVFTSILKQEFKEEINNKVDTLKSQDGKLLLGMVPNRAKIKVLKIRDENYVNYVFSDDWSEKGEKVSSQASGFEIKLRSRTWSGRSNTIEFIFGYFEQGSNNTNNFSDDTEFTNGPGIWFGGSYRFTQYFNPEKWNKWNWTDAKGLTLWGIGTGLSTSYKLSSITSSGFEQNRYGYIDAAGDSCQVQFMGTGSFKETNGRLDVKIPIFGDMKTRLSDNNSINLQLGVNFVFPVQTKHKTTEGSFSRWGYYDLNNKPITDDTQYNYFTNKTEPPYEGNNFSWHMELEGRINFLFGLKEHDNKLIVGLSFMIPIFEWNNFDDLDNNEKVDHSNYRISTNNDEYHSLMRSKEKSYNYFVGLSFGINLMRFKTE